jgi:hypothetical protein
MEARRATAIRRCESATPWPPFVGSRPVHNTVDARCSDRGQTGQSVAGNCFCCRFRATLRWIKKTLPFRAGVTILGVQQTLEHKM